MSGVFSLSWRICNGLSCCLQILIRLLFQFLALVLGMLKDARDKAPRGKTSNSLNLQLLLCHPPSLPHASIVRCTRAFLLTVTSMMGLARSQAIPHIIRGQLTLSIHFMFPPNLASRAARLTMKGETKAPAK